MSKSEELLLKISMVNNLEVIANGGNSVPAWWVSGAVLDYLKEQGLVEGAGRDSRGDEYIRLSKLGTDFYQKNK